jgi:hypothetical protein
MWSQYGRCKVGKGRWFWVVFDDVTDEFTLRSTKYGYEATAAAAEDRARSMAGPWADKTYAYVAREFHKVLVTGYVSPSLQWNRDWYDQRERERRQRERQWRDQQRQQQPRRKAQRAPHWSIQLGLILPCGIDQVKTAYRRLAKAAHPDAGGTAERFIAIESAYREALDYVQRYGPSLAS